MQNSSNPTGATNVNPESFKVQLKKLSGKSNTRKASNTGGAFDGLFETNKPALAKPQVTKAKRLSGQDDPDNQSDSVQSDVANSTPTDASAHNASPFVKEELAANGTSTNPVSNSVSIAGLSTYERQGTAKSSSASFESQSETLGDTVLAQITPVSVVTGSIATSASSFSLPGLGAGLGALALAGGGKGGASGGASQTVSTPTTPTDISTTLTGFLAAGPVINNGGLKVEAFDASGNLLASTSSIQSDGTFSVSLEKAFAGIVKLVVSDTNDITNNYIDEATGLGKSLGTAPLVTIFNLPAGQTTFSVNVNPLTTEAANNVMAAVNTDLTKATSNDISNANIDVATKYGLLDASKPETLITQPTALLIDSNGVMNPKFNDYGVALAIKSVVDDNPNLSIKDAVKALAQNPLYSGWSDGTMSWTNFLFGFSASFLTNSTPTGKPSISGSATQGNVLTASSTNIDDADGMPNAATISYQWQSSLDGITWTDIANASGTNATTFTTTQDQVGQQVRVVATFTDALGKLERVESNPTAVIANVNDDPISSLTISGTPAQNQTLSAPTITDLDGIPTTGAAGALSYQWQSSPDGTTNWTDISGATASTFTTTQTQVNKCLRVVATYTDNFGKVETVTSNPTLTIANVNDPPTGAIAISGNAIQGNVLTVTANITDLDGIKTDPVYVGSPGINWQSSSDGGATWTNINTYFSPIASANAGLTLTQNLVGKLVRAVYTYTDNFGYREYVYSAASSSISASAASSSISASAASNPSQNTVSATTPLSIEQLGATQSFSAGDINGDGIADWIFGFRGGNAYSDPKSVAGKAYVMYGNTSGKFDLSSAASGAVNDTLLFTMATDITEGSTSAIQFFSNSNICFSPAVVRDSNGNGIGEVMFGTVVTLLRIDTTGQYLDLVEKPPAERLLRLQYFDSDHGYQGYYTMSSGDINGDGFSDLAIGTFFNINSGYIVFGNNGLSGTLLPGALTSSVGFQIKDSQGTTALCLSYYMSFSGDANGDGYDDLAVANSYAEDPSLHLNEEFFIIFGSSQISNFDVNTIRNGTSKQGYVINCDPLRPYLGYGMNINNPKVFGDFNGDGLSDLVFKGEAYDHSAVKFYVVFGKQTTTPINLNALGNNGFSITLPNVALRSNVINTDAVDEPRDTAANCGDINGDGIDDILIVLAFNTSLNADNKTNHLLAYVVYGKTDPSAIDLDNLGTGGYKLFDYTRSQPVLSNLYGTITAPGDINGDGIEDLIIDDYFKENGLMPSVLLGSSMNQFLGTQNKFTYQGTSGNDTLNFNTNNKSETYIGGAGDDVIVGNGGADVMYGGAGNDTFYLSSDNVNQLKNPMGAEGRLARIDGGGGIDTLALDGQNISLDLTTIANTRIQSVEKIYLGSNNSVTLSWKDVQNMSAMNIFNSKTGWSGFNASTVKFHQLVIEGSTFNSVSFLQEGGWAKESFTVENAGQQYSVYNNAAHATELLINQQITAII